MMTWVDIVVIALLVTVAIIEGKRGFGRALFDLIGVFIALRLSSVLVNPESGVLRPAVGSETISYLITFGVLAAVFVVIGHFIYSTMLFSADAFDAAFGVAIGLLVGVIICHAFVYGISIRAGVNESNNVVLASSISGEFLEFTTYHKIMNFLYTFNR